MPPVPFWVATARRTAMDHGVCYDGRPFAKIDYRRNVNRFPFFGSQATSLSLLVFRFRRFPETIMLRATVRRVVGFGFFITSVFCITVGHTRCAHEYYFVMCAGRRQRLPRNAVNTSPKSYRTRGSRVN